MDSRFVIPAHAGTVRLHAPRRVLRLIEESPPRPEPGRDPRRAVAVENHAASAVDLDDARLRFASRVADTLDGGRAACLAPDKRRALVAAAVDKGLRPFDANLIIAIVQDAARRGETPSGTTLRLVSPPVRRAPAWAAPLAALVLATALFAALVWVFTH